nr:alpha-1,4 glucan phosphorylase L isozyme, chloroplastic/amyloplastic-like [Ipomoea batatas]
MEASGTSTMKFAVNGCILIRTLDGANIEKRQEAKLATLREKLQVTTKLTAVCLAGLHPVEASFAQSTFDLDVLNVLKSLILHFSVLYFSSLFFKYSTLVVSFFES